VAAVLVTAVVSVFGTMFVQDRRQPTTLSTGAPANAQPTAAIDQAVTDLATDLKWASISEQSYATDNNGKYVADRVDATAAATDPLVSNGLKLIGNATITVTLFVDPTWGGSYCVSAVSTQTPQVRYLTSTDDVVTAVKPVGCG
jgi:ribosomal protein S12 methylthiotransferase accessory factor YcaO